MSNSIPSESIWSRMTSSDNPGASMSEVSRARTNQARRSNRNGIRLENVAPDHDLTGARMMRLGATDEASSTSHGMHDRKSGGGGIRQANPAMSGNAPRRPSPFDTRPTTSHDSMGRPSPGGATRSRTPSASTPSG